MKGAVFTIVKNERWFLPVWLRYYQRFFAPEDIYVIDNGSDDGSIDDDSGYVRVNHRGDYAFDVQRLLDRVSQFQRRLFGWGYDFVLFAEADEIVVPSKGDFARHIAIYSTVRCTAMEVVHDVWTEPALDWSKPILAQRAKWARIPVFDKPLLSRTPLTWEFGFHNCTEPAPIDENLVLIHLRRVDMARSRARLAERRLWQRPPGQADNMAWQWALPMESFDQWFTELDSISIPIPEKYKNAV